MKDDSFMVPLETENVDEGNSAGSKVKNFLGQFFLFLVVCALIAVLVIQIIIIASTSQVKATDALDIDAIAEAQEAWINEHTA